MGPKTNNDFAGKTSKQLLHTLTARDVSQKNMIMGPFGPEIRNGCADEGQQLIFRPAWSIVGGWKPVARNNKRIIIDRSL